MIETKWESTLWIEVSCCPYGVSGMSDTEIPFSSGLEPPWLFGAASIWRTFGLYLKDRGEKNPLAFPLIYFLLLPLSLRVPACTDLALWTCFSCLQNGGLLTCTRQCFLELPDAKHTIPKHSKQCKGMKLLIKCKNKAAWHRALFWKRFLNYRGQHLPFSLSVV